MNSFKSFFYTLRRFKLASTLNILGLSIAFAAFMVLMMQVNYELSFDKGYKKSGRIYRVEIAQDGINYGPLMSRPLLNTIVEGIPQIENATLIDIPFGNTLYCSVDKGGTQEGFSLGVQKVYPDYVKIFDVEFVAGSGDALSEPSSAIIPVSIAEKLFGTVECIGKTITIADTKEELVVGGVHKDFAKSCSQTNVIRRNVNKDQEDNWGNSNYYCFVSLTTGSSRLETNRLLTSEIKKKMASKENVDWLKNISVRVTPIEDIYYMPVLDFDVAPKGNRSTTNILIAIAFLVILIASINFVNFATSLTPLRIKSINTQKVLGSLDSKLRFSMIIESVAFAVTALVVAFVWVETLRIADFSQYLITQIDFGSNMLVIWGTVGVAVVAGVLAGIYPAFYSTSFEPALVLKGSFGLSPKGRMLRTALIGIQFVISIALIIAAIFMQLQNGYMRSFNTGMDTEQVALVKLSEQMAQFDKKSLIINELKSSPLVRDIAFASASLGARDTYMRWGRQLEDGTDFVFDCIPVSWNFCSVMGLEIVDGRDLNQDDELRRGTAIFNEKARKTYSLTTDKRFGGHDTLAEIVGFVKDFNYKSLRYPIEPMALYSFGKSGWYNLPIAYIRVQSDPFAAAAFIENTLKKIDPAYPVQIEFYDAVFNDLYQKERKTTVQITSFSLLAVLISLFGVFGVVVFETQFRRKEIGVRKVYGSTVGEILHMFNRKFVYIVAVCFVIAIPLAYFGVSSWLETFQYRVDISWWVFVVAFLIVGIVTLATVTIQSYRAATENPVDSLMGD